MAKVLSLVLAHGRSLAETELRLRRDLVEELLAGTDAEPAKERARALGYDLARPHRVVVVTQDQNRPTSHESFFHAVRRAARKIGVGALLASRANNVAVLCDRTPDWEDFRSAIMAELGSRGSCRIGVGAPCTEPSEFPRSYWQAQLALKLQTSHGCPDQVAVFDDLGAYQLLSELANISSVESFIQRWLGALLDYDSNRGTQLVETLSAYLECGGNYDATASALSVHRSTLRYRLQRVHEISGFQLSEPDARFNLQLATRAWATVHAMRRRS